MMRNAPPRQTGTRLAIAALAACGVLFSINWFTGGRVETLLETVPYAGIFLYPAVVLAAAAMLFLGRLRINGNLAYLAGGAITLIAFREPISRLAVELVLALRGDGIFNLILGGIFLGVLFRFDLLNRSFTEDSASIARALCIGERVLGAAGQLTGRVGRLLQFVATTALATVTGMIASLLAMEVLGRAWFRPPSGQQPDDEATHRLVSVHYFSVVGSHALPVSIQWAILSGSILTVPGQEELALPWLLAIPIGQHAVPVLPALFAAGLAALAFAACRAGSVFGTRGPSKPLRGNLPSARGLNTPERRVRHVYNSGLLIIAGAAVAWITFRWLGLPTETQDEAQCEAQCVLAAPRENDLQSVIRTAVILTMVAVAGLQLLVIGRAGQAATNRDAARLGDLILDQAAEFFRTVFTIVLLIAFSSILKIAVKPSTPGGGYRIDTDLIPSCGGPWIDGLLCLGVTLALAAVLGSIFLSLSIGWILFNAMGLLGVEAGPFFFEVMVIGVFALNLLFPASPNLVFVRNRFERITGVNADAVPTPGQMAFTRLGPLPYAAWLVLLTVLCCAGAAAVCLTRGLYSG